MLSDEGRGEGWGSSPGPSPPGTDPATTGQRPRYTEIPAGAQETCRTSTREMSLPENQKIYLLSLPGSYKAVGHGVDKLTRHSEITNLYLALGVDQDVAGLHIPAKKQYLLLFEQNYCPSCLLTCG